MEEMMEKIHYELEDEIATIRMDDGKANAMDFAFFEQMDKAIDRLEGDNAKTLILMGRPGYFSGGLDVKLMPSLSPTELNTFVETFARTMLRVFTLALPTVAVCPGHTVAGGAILAFSCDLRFIVEGPYRIQMNEMTIGIPLPSWMLLIGRCAIPVQWLAEALLHARAYSPTEAVERGIFHGLIKNGENVEAYGRDQSVNLKTLNMHAYATSKNRMRASEVKHVLELLKEELPFNKA
jgi:enoyl-CoA hydratase